MIGATRSRWAGFGIAPSRGRRVAGVVLIACLAGVSMLGPSLQAQDNDNDGDEDIDQFMERVLERREENSIALTQYVLDERETLALNGPGQTLLQGFRHDYTWYMREGYLIRSPVAFDGVRIDETRRREYEADWLRQERRRDASRQRQTRPLSRRSRRSTRDNVRRSIERLWGEEVSSDLLRSIAEDARLWGDDRAAITAAGDRILADRGGVPAVGFGRAVARTRDAFAMLETERLDDLEVARLLGALMPVLAAEARSAPDEDIAQFVELFELSARFMLRLGLDDATLERARAALVDDPERSVALAAAVDVLRALTVTDAAREGAAAGVDASGGSTSNAPADLQPRFVSESYFLDFEFEPGNYYLAGRERLAGREVLRIEYYPTRLFADDERDGEDTDGQVEVRIDSTGFDKTSLVTLWVDPAEFQIVKFTFDNVGFDFLPGRWLARLDDLTASMTMGQSIAGVWLPERVEILGQVTLAIGSFEVSYSRAFSDYREADVGGRIRSYGPPR